MKAALISLGSVSSKWTAGAMKRYFDKVDDINIKDLEINLGLKTPEVIYKGKPLGEYDCIYAKGSFRYATLLDSLSLALGKKAYMPIMPGAFTVGNNKLLTHLQLQEKNIPMPVTYLASTAATAKKVLEKINYPIVMKFPEGTQGRGVMFADSFASASSVLDALTALKQPLIIQEYIETGETDIRAIVVDEKVVASMKRKAIYGEKRANIHAGGEGEACILDENTKKIAIQTAKAVGADICAVDLLESVKGPLVIEINLAPGLQGITKATKIDVAEKIAKFLFDKTKEMKGVSKKEEATKILKEVGIVKPEKVEEILTELDFRGSRILLPELVTKLTKFKEGREYIVKANEGKLEIKEGSDEE